MQRLKIEVNEGVLDLFQGTDEMFYITKQLNDLHNLQNRQADFTRSLEIPASDNNRSLLGILTNERTDNLSQSVNILLDDILVIAYGRILIITDSKTVINIAIFAGNFELFDSIPNDSVKILDFAAYAFPWTLAGIAAIQTNTTGVTCTNTQFLSVDSLDNGTGIIARFVNNTDIKNYGFVLYYKTLIKEIIEQSGFILDDSLLTSDDQYNDTFIACPVFLPGSTEDVVSGVVQRTTDYVYDASILLGVPDRITFVVLSDPAAMWNAPSDHWVVPTTGEWIVTFDFTITNDNGAGLGPAEIEILNTGAPISLTEYFEVTNEHHIITQVINANAGDLIYIEVTAEFRNSSRFDTVTIDSGATFTLQENTPDPTGAVNVSDWIPDINQIKALLDFLKLFNANIDSNPFLRTVKIVPFNDIIDTTAQDLTLNVDARQLIDNNISMDGYFRLSEMVYNTDSEVIRTDTDQTVSFQKDESLPQRGQILGIDFSPSDDDGVRMVMGAGSLRFRSVSGFSTAGVPTNIFSFAKDEVFKSGDYIRFIGASSPFDRIDRIRFVTGKRAGQVYDNYTVTITNSDVEIIEIDFNNIVPRIGMINRAAGPVSPFFTLNGYVGANSQTFFPVNRSFFNLQMNKIYTTYYQRLFDALQTPKILKVWMNFNALDFSNIDMTKPAIIDGFNGIYYINKIEQFKINTPCLVELIRINPLI